MWLVYATLSLIFQWNTPQIINQCDFPNAVGVVLSKRNPPWIQVRDNVIHIAKYMFQRHRCCVFDSPGLPNDSAGYPGLMYGLRGPTPSVLRFFDVIRYQIPRYNYAFSEKAQHRWRWISLRTFTRGRLVPRQPRAIKRTTPTALHHEGIYIAKYIHWDIEIFCHLFIHMLSLIVS